MSDQVPETITDETVVITKTAKFNGVDCAQYEYLGDLDEPYRTALLTSAEKDAKIKELEGMLNEAMRLLRIVDEEADLTHPMFLLSNWNKEYEALKKLKAE